jgi:hypothetical protein
MADPAGATQTAIISKYRGDATLQGILTGYNASIASPIWNVYDQGGSGALSAAFPYIIVHPITMQLGTAFSMGGDAADIYLQVSVFTRYEGFAQARAVAARCYALTHGPLAGALTISGFTNVLTLFDGRQELEEVTDGLIQHIADRYKLMVQG